ncbi:MAG: helix-turn-helix domain-containing protein [Rhodospirillales bacterium]|nr:helix-turn-helix domain-containing protein [Rhodospirillales bacterium]
MARPAAAARRTPNGSRLIDVTIVLLDEGYASTAVGPIEVFHSAGRLWNMLAGKPEEPRFRVQVASIDGRPVTSICGLKLQPALSIRDVRRTDIVILPSTGLDAQERIARNTPLLPWLKRLHAGGAYIAGVCSGVGFLAECGLLDGRTATTHWAVAEALQLRYPKVDWRPDLFVTEDGRLLCSGGVYAAIDLSLYLVEKICGHEVAIKTAKSLLVSMPRSRQSGYATVPLSRPHGDGQIRIAEAHLQEHYREDVSNKVLAGLVGMGERNFIRRFKAATGHLPSVYGQMLRVSAAKELLERSATPVQTVAEAIGYVDVPFFRALFRRHTGMTPAEYRANFAGMNVERGDIAGA